MLYIGDDENEMALMVTRMRMGGCGTREKQDCMDVLRVFLKRGTAFGVGRGVHL